MQNAKYNMESNKYNIESNNNIILYRAKNSNRQEQLKYKMKWQEYNKIKSQMRKTIYKATQSQILYNAKIKKNGMKVEKGTKIK